MDEFSDMTTMDPTTKVSGVFGNGITNIIAQFRPTRSLFEVDDVSEAAMSIRKALQQGYLDIPERIVQSRMGRASPPPSSYSTFATTSWAQFPIWDVKFAPCSELVAFHGHPAHPLAAGQTFSSVIMSTSDGGCIYKLLLPCEKAEEARTLHQALCVGFMEWYAAHIATKNQHSALIRP